MNKLQALSVPLNTLDLAIKLRLRAAARRYELSGTDFPTDWWENLASLCGVMEARLARGESLKPTKEI